MIERSCKFSRNITVLPSMCGGDSKLGIQSALDMFQDTATIHAESVDLGPTAMDRNNSFWVITKTRIHILRMPKMLEEVASNTWIQKCERASCERDYSITSGDETLAYGRSIWAVVSHETGRLLHLDKMYPDVEFTVPVPDDRPFVRIGRDFDGCEVIGEYKVRSIDIDLGGHMNNVNYVRAMLGCFSSEELAALNISEIETNFLAQTFEGETLTFRRRDFEGGFDIGAAGTDGKTAFAARVTLG